MAMASVSLGRALKDDITYEKTDRPFELYALPVDSIPDDQRAGATSGGARPG